MNFNYLIGKICSNVFQSGDDIIFVIDNDGTYRLTHYQDCCEHVYIESITGELSDLIGSPITFADESSNEGMTEDGTETWTFYKLATFNGWVDIRFYGESNGYYSESISFIKDE